MPILKFIFYSLKPLSKTADIWDIKDIIQAILIVLGWGGGGAWTLAISKDIATWILAGIPALLFLVAGIKLQFRVSKFENTMPKLNAELQSFPQSGYTIIMDAEKDAPSPQKGYAKIAIKNTGGLLRDCVGTVAKLSVVDLRTGQVKLHPLEVTHTALVWDSGETHVNIQNDGVGKYLRLAYLDQNRPESFVLAIEAEQRQAYPMCWYKIDIVISSESQHIEPLRVEVALGPDDRVSRPPSLVLWSWEKWHESRGLKQETDKEGS